MSGSQCCENPPTPGSSSGGGSIEEVAGLKSYISGSPDSKRAILLVSDIFGYEAPKLRKLADKVAAAGFYVVVPDFFNGDPYAPENSERPIQVWIKSHGAEKGTEDANSVIAALLNKDIPAIGVAGFCWGAKVAVNLAKSDDVKAAVLLHPSFVTLDDIKEVRIPIAVLGAELDNMSPPSLLIQFDEALSAKPEVEFLVKIYNGVSHGWSVRYQDDDQVAVKCAGEAQDDMIGWFVKYAK